MMSWGRKFEPELEARYQETQRKASESAFHLATGLATILYPVFSLVDYFTQRTHFHDLTVIRYTAEAVMVAIYFRIRAMRGRSSPYAAGAAMLSVAAFGITCMILRLDGYPSPYYAGVNLVMLGASLLFPWGARRMTAFLIWIFLLYLIPVLIHAGFKIENVPIFINNIAFMLSTVIVGASAAALSDQLRRQSFAQHMAAVDARDRIAKSVQIISRELRPESGVPSEEQAFQELVSLSRELVEARTEAQGALRVRDEFISTASHELKTPLTVLQLQHDCLKKIMTQPTSGLDEGTRNKMMFQVKLGEAQVRRLVRLIEDLLDLSRMESGQFLLHREQVNFEDLARSVIEHLAPQLERAGIQASIRAESPAVGEWDHLRLEQLLINLLGNAIKYAPNAPLEIHVRSDAKLAHITVQDFGPGIPANKLHSIFDRYERATNDQGVSGLGLGLYISHKIVTTHGGKIWVESEPGMGAAFKIELPLKPA